MATIKQAKYKQVDSDGSVILYHFQTNADIVIDGILKRVPLITEIANWDSIKAEVETARGGKTNLNLRLNEIEENIKAENLLNSLKTVDGKSSGLNADLVDDCEVNDSATSSTILWTSNKTNTELNKKLNSTEVVTTATANKLLKLNADGLLPASVTGNSGTATKLETSRKISITGDATGNANFDGSADVSISIAVSNNSHDHKEVKNAGATIAETTATSGNVIDFKSGGAIKSSIDFSGNFTGSAAKISGKSINDAGTTTNDILTASKVYQLLTPKMDKAEALEELALKMDIEEALFYLDLKMDSDEVTDKLALKMDKAEATTLLALKMDKTEAQTKLDAKMSKTEASTALALKMDATNIASTSNSVTVGDTLIQWGTKAVTATSDTITFPIQYGSAPKVIISDETMDLAWVCKIKPATTTTTKFEIHANEVASEEANVNWISIGKKK